MARLVKRRNRGEDDFEILFPDFTLFFGSVRFAIHEYTILEGARYAVQARTALSEHQIGHSVALVVLLAENCGRDILEVAGLEDEHFTVLVTTFERANRQWLSEVNKTGDKERWSSIVQCLISHGHKRGASSILVWASPVAKKQRQH